MIATYPQYEMVIDGSHRWMSLRDAGIMYDNGYCKVEIGGQVMTSEGHSRPITDAERTQIRNIADDFSASR